MGEYRNITVSLLKRGIPAAVCFFVGHFAFKGAAASEGHTDAFPLAMIGCGVVLLGAILIARPLARLLAEPSGQLFWPDERYRHPLPMYSIPESKRAKGLYEEAIAGFDEIAKKYPDEVRPYIEMIDIAIVHLKDEARANAICLHGLSVLQKDEDKKILQHMHAAIHSRLKAQPDSTTIRLG